MRIALAIALCAACAGKQAPPEGYYECGPVMGCKDGEVLDFQASVVPPDFVTPTVCEDRSLRRCTAGCAIESLEYDYDPDLDPAILCAETPDAHEGDPCTVDDDCLPTRATVDASGVVTQAYLACDATSGACVAASPPPPAATWMQPCPSAVAIAGKPGVNGLAADEFGEPCLLAWDAATSTIANGLTPNCIGDWDCPAGTVCDDAVPPLEVFGDDPIAVCRPGARGTPLDPSTLHP
jgi:hypothetical protein